MSKTKKIGKFSESSDEIIRLLKSRIPAISCPLCNHEDFTLIGGYSTKTITDDPHSVVLGGRVIPSVNLVCGNCGYILEISVGVLGELGSDKNE